MTASEIVTSMSPDLLEEAARWHHPAIASRVEFALGPTTFGHPEIPSLIVCGGSETERDLTAACYAQALINAGLCTAAGVVVVDELQLDDLYPNEDLDFEANQPVRRSYDLAERAPVLVVRNVGAARRDPPSDRPDVYGYGPFRLDDITNERHNWLRATILCSELPVGNPVGSVELDANDPSDRPAVTETDRTIIVEVRGPNRGLTTALDDRAAAGWRVPSPEAGFDPDSRLVDAGTHSLQVHLGGRVWWRIYKPARGTAVDAEAVVRNS